MKFSKSQAVDAAALVGSFALAAGLTLGAVGAFSEVILKPYLIHRQAITLGQPSVPGAPAACGNQLNR
jgi:hypothetical protein